MHDAEAHLEPVMRRVGREDDRARAAAFADLVGGPALDRAYHYAALMLGDREAAEDATHDAALTAWRRFGELRDPARFEAWFGRILVNVCRDRRRRQRRQAPGIDAQTALIDRAHPGPDLADDIGRRDALTRAIRGLSHDQCEVIVLRFYLDLTVDQIAARTGARAGTVKSRLHYALQALHAAIDAEAAGGPPR
ncbi:MAG TPA: sigma-70 family RNA polymerase sigma factor [Candidatus Sulfotelmatobacter sp.]|nr:sigma-70 family RNA polymerase sigma factor [Candidatus Sulfotelmatobacter sp.]